MAAAVVGEAQSSRSHPGRGHCGLRTAAAVADDVAVGVGADADVGAGSDQGAFRAGQTVLRPSTASVGACWEVDAMLGAFRGDASPSAAQH